MNLVHDAGALPCYLRGESGADLVSRLLGDASNVNHVHAVNLCEVYYDLLREHGESEAQAGIAALREFGLVVREDMDEEFWREAGRHKAGIRRISLADCFCTALANRIGGEVVTADHHEFDAVVERGLCTVRFIR